MNLIAQTFPTTQPTTGLPSWAVGILAIIGALAPIFFAWLAYKRAGEAKDVARDAQVDAAEARAGNDSAQQSITRISSRQNAFTDTVAKRLHEMPPPPVDASASSQRPIVPPPSGSHSL